MKQMIKESATPVNNVQAAKETTTVDAEPKTEGIEIDKIIPSINSTNKQSSNIQMQ